MNNPAAGLPADSLPETSREWLAILAKYRSPNAFRSVFELVITLGAYLLLWVLAWMALSVSYWLALAIALVNSGFLVRLFVIQHDCGHSSFLTNRNTGDWIGRVLGVLTLTPYDVWRRTHSIHHASSGNLDKRGFGDVHTLTVNEFRELSAFSRLMYRIYRSPVFMFGVAPVLLFFLQHRVPYGLWSSGWKYWLSAMGTNLAVGVLLGLMVYFGGWMPLVLIFLPTSSFAAAAGVWMFYVQHQFETTQWDTTDKWELHDCALYGSSNYALPAVLQWLTANIGIHHVHHLYSRIPFYRLTEVLRDYPVLRDTQRLTLADSLSCAKLQLWDEKKRRLLSYAQAKALYGPL